MIHKYSKSVFNIPSRFKNSTLENFSFTENPNLMDTLEEWINKEHQGLVLWGRPGVGKTHLAVALYRMLIYGDIGKALFMPFNELCTYVKEGYSENQNRLQTIHKYEILLIDDIFAGQTSARDNEILSEIIQNRYNTEKPYLLTTNMSPNEAQRYFNYHEQSRLFGMCIWNEVKSTKDWRID